MAKRALSSSLRNFPEFSMFCRFSASMCCCATWRLTPFRSRATISQLLLCRASSVAWSGAHVNGIHKRASRPGA